MEESKTFFEKYYKDVFRFLRGLSANEDLAEEQILHDLREPYKEIFSFRIFGELSFREIGELFEKSEHWACVTYHRAREMIVKDYKMVYYNPWDAQYLSCLVVEYEDEDYAREVKRLANYPTTEYKGYYGTEGFDEKYELLAMNADSYHGFVYALSGGENDIIYVEIIFCNYFLDIDYEEYIDADYLPVGFDASEDNAYRKQQEGILL